jgi:hypothetical protein
MAQQPPAVEGNGSDDAAYRLARVVIDLGLNEDTAAEVMAGWAGRCGFDDDWIAAKVHNAFKYGQNDPGCLAAPDPTTNVTYLRIAREAAPEGLPIHKVGELRAETPKEVEELIPGWLEKGITAFLAAPGKMHKSRLGLQWGLSLQAGLPVFGKPVRQCQSVMISYEDDLSELTRRVYAMAAGLKLPTAADGAEIIDLSSKSRAKTLRNKPLLTVTENGVVETELWFQLRDYFHEIPGHKLIVLDSCYNAI